MVDFYKKYEDVFVEEWVEFEGARFKIRSSEHPRVLTASIQYQEFAENKDMIEYLAKLYSEAIVTDWEEVDFNGEPQAFSVPLAYKLFRDIPAITLHLFNNHRGKEPINLEEEEKKS